jgi:hypothetical protein
MPYLSCPSCRFTVSEHAARSPFQNCPRCLLRDSASVMMVPTAEPPPRFGRTPADVERIAEAKTRVGAARPRLSRPPGGVGSA